MVDNTNRTNLPIIIVNQHTAKKPSAQMSTDPNHNQRFFIQYYSLRPCFSLIIIINNGEIYIGFKVCYVMPEMKTETRRGLVAAGAALIALITLVTLSPTPLLVLYYLSQQNTTIAAVGTSGGLLGLAQAGLLGDLFTSVADYGFTGGVWLATAFGAESLDTIILVGNIMAGVATFGVGALIAIGAF